MSKNKALAWALLGLGLTLPLLATGVARAEPLGAHQTSTQASLGFRLAKISSAGYDPFSTSDDFTQVSLGLGRTVLAFDQWSLAAVGYWDVGAQSGKARGHDTELTAHRLALGPELRYHLLPQLYLLAHVLPAYGHVSATLKDDVANATLEARHRVYGVDLALGGAVELYGLRAGDPWTPRIWLIAEGGYGYLSAATLRMRVDTSQSAQVPARTQPVDLGTLNVSGAFLRASVAVSL